MIPIIDNISEDDNTLTFNIQNINFSCINSLRRLILSEIPCVVFETTPYEKNQATIDTNTTRFNNEILKQRLSCIPIHISDQNFPVDDYVMLLDKKNTTDSIIYVTSDDFQIKNLKTEKFLSKDEVRNIFPSDSITGDFIDFVRLRPNINNMSNGEQIKLSCKFIRNIAKNNGSYNVVSTCAYNCIMDEEAAKIAWLQKEQEYKSKNINPEEIEYFKNDFMNLDAKRFIVKNAFKFTLETIGIYTNFRLIELACLIINKKLANLLIKIQSNNDLITKSNNTMENCFDIILENEDYTIGKILEYMLYEKYFEESKELSYCGFIKKHPHDLNSIIRLTFKEDVSNDLIITYFADCIKKLQEIFTKIKDEFK